MSLIYIKYSLFIICLKSYVIKKIQSSDTTIQSRWANDSVFRDTEILSLKFPYIKIVPISFIQYVTKILNVRKREHWRGRVLTMICNICYICLSVSLMACHAPLVSCHLSSVLYQGTRRGLASDLQLGSRNLLLKQIINMLPYYLS